VSESFKDNEGRTWELRLDFGAAKRVRALVGVNLLSPMKEVEPGGPPLLARLGEDDMVVVDVIYAIIKPQTDERGITDEEWAAAMGGDAMLEAHDAFYREYVNFFRSRNRPEVITAIQKHRATIDAAVSEATARMEKMDPETVVRKIFSDLDTNSADSAE
jgi:hypothetical protein